MINGPTGIDKIGIKEYLGDRIIRNAYFTYFVGMFG
jgi:hypothetical protein